jgi:hypothetical protein
VVEWQLVLGVEHYPVIVGVAGAGWVYLTMPADRADGLLAEHLELELRLVWHTGSTREQGPDEVR